MAGIGARAAIESGQVGPILERLHIPVLYVDRQVNPIINAQKTVAVLRRALNRGERADAYLLDYGRRLDALLPATRQEPRHPSIFIEVRAGRMVTEQCCFTQGKTA